MFLPGKALRRAALTWRNDCSGQVEVKQAGGEVKRWMVSAKMEQKNFNAPFVLARHRAHRLLDGQALLARFTLVCHKCIVVYYLFMLYFLTEWRQSASDEDPESPPSSDM